MSRTIDETLTPLLGEQKSWVLLDFPDYPNVGDSAIWLGEINFLQAKGLRVTFACAFDSFSPSLLASWVGKSPILLHGGGNLGDLYPHVQRFRERIVALFPDNKIVQLPQSIYFADPSQLERARRVFNNHRNFTLLVREQRSLERAQSAFDVPVLLCPDMAFALGPLRRAPVDPADIIWLARTDAEALETHRGFSHDGGSIDWLNENPPPLSPLKMFLVRQMTLHPKRLRPLSTCLLGIYARIARRRLLRGCHMLSRGRVVITDRLHGHILSLLLGIPHVVLDNSHGKLSSFWETWSHESALGRWANSVEEAFEIAEGLAGNIRADKAS
jgi:pyruvyl transferase EpsO